MTLSVLVLVVLSATEAEQAAWLADTMRVAPELAANLKKSAKRKEVLGEKQWTGIWLSEKNVSVETNIFVDPNTCRVTALAQSREDVNPRTGNTAVRVTFKGYALVPVQSTEGEWMFKGVQAELTVRRYDTGIEQFDASYRPLGLVATCVDAEACTRLQIFDRGNLAMEGEVTADAVQTWDSLELALPVPVKHHLIHMHQAGTDKGARYIPPDLVEMLLQLRARIAEVELTGAIKRSVLWKKGPCAIAPVKPAP